MIGKVGRRLFDWAFVVSVFVLVATAAVFAWERYAPVIIFERALNIDLVGRDLTAEIYARKLRGCEYVDASEVGWIRVENTWREVPFAYLNDRSPGDTRPLGRQFFGVWQWSDVHHDARAFRTTVQHKCSDGLRITTIGPFKVR